MTTINHQEHLVSVIIPVRNARNYIIEAIESVLNQNYQNTEIIIIDDGSDDYDYKKLSEIDQRIRVICLAGNGVSFARNIGMGEAKGQYIAFLDADDVWFPGKLTAQISYLNRHASVGCVFGGFFKWHPDELGKFPPANLLWSECSGIVNCELNRSGWIYTKLINGLLVGMNTAVIRREVFDLLGGFDESMRIGEDYLFWLKTSRLYEMHALDSPVALYRIHPTSAMSRLDPENHQARLLNTAFSRWGLSNPDGSYMEKKEFNKRIALSEFTHGYNHFWNGNPKIAKKSFMRAALGGALPLRSLTYYLLSVIKEYLPLYRQRRQ
jgi:glycosyltransferase involved in cell wall biosynthesis